MGRGATQTATQPEMGACGDVRTGCEEEPHISPVVEERAAPITGISVSQCVMQVWLQKKGFKPYTRPSPKDQKAKVTQSDARKHVRSEPQYLKLTPDVLVRDASVPILETWNQLVESSAAEGRHLRLSSRTVEIIRQMKEWDKKKTPAAKVLFPTA